MAVAEPPPPLLTGAVANPHPQLPASTVAKHPPRHKGGQGCTSSEHARSTTVRGRTARYCWQSGKILEAKGEVGKLLQACTSKLSHAPIQSRSRKHFDQQNPRSNRPFDQQYAADNGGQGCTSSEHLFRLCPCAFCEWHQLMFLLVAANHWLVQLPKTLFSDHFGHP